MTDSNNNKVMVAGHIALDIAPKFPKLLTGKFHEIFTPGKLIHVEDAVINTGGPVSNTGLAMAKFGIDVVLNAKVGNDEFGNITKKLIGPQRASAIKTVEGQNSSYTVILALADIDRIFLHNPGTNDTFGADDVDYDAASKCALFHFGYPPLMRRMFEDDGEELLKIFKRVKETGVTTSLDMALPDPSSAAGKANWKKIVEKILPYVNIFIPSIEETTFMLNRSLFEQHKTESAGQDPVLFYKPEDYTAISDELLAMGGKIIALKSGIRGCYLRTASAEQIESIGSCCPSDLGNWSNRELWSASFKTDKFGSAAGSGDSTIAGFLSAFVRGFRPQQCLKIANAAGWQNVQEIDTLTGIKDWKSTIEFVKDKNKPCNELTIDAEGWRYSETEKIFLGPQDKH